MAIVELGWKLPTWVSDGSSGSELIRQADEHLRRLQGTFQSVWLADHFLPSASWQTPAAPTIEALSATAYFAARHPSYRFGNMVLATSYRNPALVAKSIATLQLLTGGRMILGIGAGWMESEYRAYGYEFPSASTRIQQLEEAVRIVRLMWSQAPATFHGRHFHIDDAYCEPRPDPVPPIMIGGTGEQLTMRVVARYADWWNMPGSQPIETFRHKLDVLRRHCDQIGRDPASLTISWECICLAVAPTHQEATRIAEASRFFPRATPEAAIVGTPAEIVEQFHRYADAGMNVPMIRFADYPRLDCAELFVEQVAPHLGLREKGSVTSG